MLAMSSLGALARQYVPQTYANNLFQWKSDVYENPNSIDVQPSRISIVGSGGIKINTTQTAHDGYQVAVDGSAIAANGGAAGATTGLPAARVDGDFSAATNGTYFVAKTATCLLPSAVGAVGKEILVWNACPPGGVVTYKTTQGQTISGAASGAVNNATTYKLDRFMSDGATWYRE
jgi:hypothetical protein